jgi:hypothetical protein
MRVRGVCGTRIELASGRSGLPVVLRRLPRLVRARADCWSYLVQLRWPDGFSCPACGSDDAWLTRRFLFVCSNCQRQTSVIAGTVFEGTKLPLLAWFRAAWLITSQKNGVSAKSLPRELGLGSYRTAWTLHHKLRKAMVRPDQAKLSGEIEVDETFVGGPRKGKRGRGALNKQIVIIAVEKPTGHVQQGFVAPGCVSFRTASARRWRTSSLTPASSAR